MARRTERIEHIETEIRQGRDRARLAYGSDLRVVWALQDGMGDRGARIRRASRRSPRGLRGQAPREARAQAQGERGHAVSAGKKDGGAMGQKDPRSEIELYLNSLSSGSTLDMFASVGSFKS